MPTYIKLRQQPSRGHRGGFFKMLLLAIGTLAVIAASIAVYLLFGFQKPTLVLDKQIKYLGGVVDLPLHITDKQNGIRSLHIALTQGDKSAVLVEQQYPRKVWFRPNEPTSLDQKVSIDAQKAGIKQGQAELVITVRDFSLNGFLQGNKTELRIPVIMDTVPPTVTLKHFPRQIEAGHTELAVYTVSEKPERSGVMVDNTLYPGYPTGKKDTYVAYFALPWDANAPAKTRVVAYDEAGNEGAVPFAASFKKLPEKHDTITISDNFLQQKASEFNEHYPDLKGTLLEKYLYINNQVRVANRASVDKMCETASPEQLWSGRFLRMPGAGRANFGDQRTYMYNGQTIDHQTHLGVDIASVAKAEIRAANRGKVLYTGYMGIYGNVVIIDHGQGVASLYAHLSSIDTTVGTMVEKNQPIAHSGTTGMAGGDHLHFGMMIHGTYVDPREWWDQRWINMHINSALNEP